MTMVLPFNLIEGNLSVSFWLLYILLKPTLKHYEDKQTFFNEGVLPFTFRYSWLPWSVLPETLVGFDQPIQTAVQETCPVPANLFRAIHAWLISVIIARVASCFIFYRKRWKIESFMLKEFGFGWSLNRDL